MCNQCIFLHRSNLNYISSLKKKTENEIYLEDPNILVKNMCYITFHNSGTVLDENQFRTDQDVYDYRLGKTIWQ